MALKWYEWHTATERMQGRLYALTRGRPYRFKFDLKQPTGYCDLKNKLVGANPIAFDEVFQKEGLSGRKRDEANYLLTRAIIGHEALHTIYTDIEVLKESLKDPNEKHLFNLLEDSRIENIGAQESHYSATLFRFLSGTMYKDSPAFTDKNLDDPYSAFHLIMDWRLGMAVPELTDDARQKWIHIRNLCEDALYAPTAAEVLAKAREIIAYLKLPPPDQSQAMQQMKQILDKMLSQMSGNAPGSPKNNPIQRPAKGKGNSGGGKPDDKKDDSDGDDDQGDSQSDSDGDDKTDDQGSDGDGPDGDDSGDQGDSDRDNHDVDVSDLINDVKAATGESVSQSVPEGNQETMLRGAALGHDSSSNKIVIGKPYMEEYQLALPIAQELIRDLKGDSPRVNTGSSMYPGRLKTRYLLRDEQKPYAKASFHGLKTPTMALSVVLDRSTSMQGMIRDLRITCMAIYLACEQLKIPMEIWVLEGCIRLKEFDEWGPAVLAKIAGVTPEGCTTMMPTLNLMTSSLKKRRENIKQVVMIHDGGPGDRASVTQWAHTLGKIGLYCLYLIPGAYSNVTTAADRYDTNMEGIVGAKNYCKAYVKEVPKFWCSYMKSKIKGMASRM